MNAQVIPDWQAMYSSMYRPHEGIRPDEERRGGLVNPLVASPSSQSSTSEPFLDPRELSQQQLQQIIDARQAASMALSNPYMLAQLSMGANIPAAAASMSDFQAALLMSAANNNVPTGTLPFQGGFPMNMTTFGQSAFLAGAGLSAAQIQPVGNLNVPVASNYTALRGGRVADSNTSVASTISEKDHPAMTGITRGILEPFPERLHRLLSEVEAAGLSHIISFTEDGQAFKIHKPEEFFRRIVQVYFKQTRLSSFKRQLNLYGFELIDHGKSKGSYYHEMFVRSEPSLARQIRRIDSKFGDGNKIKNRKVAKKARSSSNVPDFYSMPPVLSNEEAAKKQAESRQSAEETKTDSSDSNQMSESSSSNPRKRKSSDDEDKQDRKPSPKKSDN
jgi:hypothetical protein